MQAKVSVETITPTLAEKWLETMVTNRKVSDSLVLDYAIAIEQGGWALNGETIKFDKEGRLFDGQHRLRGCILARKDFKSYVARGIDDERAFSTVDTGKFRTHSDVFSIGGWQSATTASAGASLLWMYDNKKLGWNGPTGRRFVRARHHLAEKLGSGSLHARTMVQKEELLRYANEHREPLQAAVKYAVSHRAKRMLFPAVFVATYYLFAEKSRMQAEKFFDDLSEGTGLEANDPVWVLRERLQQLTRTKARGYKWLSFGLAIKSWNKRRLGETVRSLHAIDAEEFPRVT